MYFLKDTRFHFSSFQNLHKVNYNILYMQIKINKIKFKVVLFLNHTIDILFVVE